MDNLTHRYVPTYNIMQNITQDLTDNGIQQTIDIPTYNLLIYIRKADGVTEKNIR